MKAKLFIPALMILIAMQLVSAYNVSVEVQLTNPTTGAVITGTYTVNFTVYNSTDDDIFTDTSSVTTDSNGRFHKYFDINYSFKDNTYVTWKIDTDSATNKSLVSYVPNAVNSEYLGGRNVDYFLANETFWGALDNSTIIRSGNSSWVIESINNTNITLTNLNVTENLTVSDTGFFVNLGSSIRKITQGWFSFLQSDEVNATQINTTNFKTVTAVANYMNSTEYRLNENVSWKLYTENPNTPGDVACLEMKGPSGTLLPHFCVQSGGGTQASYVMRSLMIVNEDAAFFDTTDYTDCGAYMSNIGETLKIDCNTTTTGADLLVSDDMQVVGDVWVKDEEGEWHFMSREMTLRDQLTKNTLESKVNFTLTGVDFNITEHEGDNLIVNVDETNIITSIISDNISITPGTNSSPQFNHVYYSGSNPDLTVALSSTADVPDVAQLLVGDGFVFGAVAGSASTENFIRGVYHRFYDDGAIYISGFDQNVSASQINISTGTMKVMLDSYDITENHTTEQYYQAYNNDTFEIGADLDMLAYYSDGTAIGNNKYFNVVCGVVLTIDEDTENDGQLMCIPQNEPNTEYSNGDLAEDDAENKVVYFPSDSLLKKIYIPVVRVVMQRAAGSNTIQALNNGELFFDVRGTVTTSGGSPPAPGISDHGNLDGLTDDDHTQYMELDGTDALTGDWDAGAFDITAGYFNGSWNGSDLYHLATTVDSTFVNLSGDTMTGNLLIQGNLTINTSANGFGGIMIFDDTSDNYNSYIRMLRDDANARMHFQLRGLGTPTTPLILKGANTNVTGSLYVGGVTHIDSADLTLDSADEAVVSIDKGSNQRFAGIHFKTAGAAADWVLGTVDAGDVSGSAGTEFFIGTDESNPKFWIESNGNIGINKTNPLHTLDIGGSLNASSGRFEVLNASTEIWVSNSSNTNKIWHNGSGICIGSC